MLARSHDTKWTLGASVWGRWWEKTLCGWFLHARRPSWCRCSPPIMCTIGRNLLPRKGQALSQKEFSGKVPETHMSLLLQESLLTIARVIATLFFSYKGKGEQMQTLSPTKQKGYWNVLSSPPQLLPLPDSWARADCCEQVCPPKQWPARED